MPFQNDILAGSSGQGGQYDIDYSLRCNGGTDAHFANSSTRYLSRSVSASTGDSKRKFTLSCWIKLGAQSQFSTDQISVPLRCIYAWADGNGDSAIGLSNTSSNSGLVNLEIVSVDSGGGYYYRWLSNINYLLRDQTAWYHLVVQIDTTQASQDNRIRAWINNEQITSWATQYRPDQNQDVYINGAGHVMLTNYIGAAFRTANSTIYNGWDGYISELHALDGILKLPTDFAETDAATNMWKAIEYDGTYGTTGIYQKYANTEGGKGEAFIDQSPKTTSDITFTTTAAITADVLIVGGGGGGGNTGGVGSGSGGGGGGAGGFRTETGLALGSGTSHAIMVGHGGGGGNSGFRNQPEITANANSQNTWGKGHTGGPSGFGTYVVDGGGGGGSQDMGARPYSMWAQYNESVGTFSGRIPLTGSAGGGGTEAYGTGGGTYGNNGGNFPTRPSPGAGCGGGGGSSADGNPGPSGTPGDGGAGTANAFQTGSNITYAGGGGAGRPGNGNPPAGGSGGSGGGGPGSNGGTGTQGTNGLGGGGGGSGNQSANAAGGGAGGSGVVIVRYLASSAQATGGTVTTYGSGGSQYYVHTFDTVNTRPIHNMTTRGDVTQSDAQSKVGGSSFYFDGSSDWMMFNTDRKQIAGTSTYNADWMHESGDAFCYEYWVRPTAVDGTRYHVSNFCSNASGSGSNVELGIYQSGTDLRVMVRGSDVISGVQTVAANTWYHVAVTRNTSNVITLWVDGVSKGTSTQAVQIGYDRSSLWVGARYQSTMNEFKGYIDELQVSDTVRHTSTFTPSTTATVADANTLLLLQTDWGGGLGKDSSGNNNGMAVTGFQATDQVIDTPQNSTGGNFCTINGLTESIANRNEFSEGNLRAKANDISGNSSAWFTATMGIPYGTGKYYWEFADEIYIDAGLFNGTYADGWGMGLVADDGHSPLMADNDINNTGWWVSKSNNNVATARARGGGTSSENKRVPSTTTGVFKCCYDSDSGSFHFGGDLGWMTSSSTATPNTDAQPGSGNDLWDSGTGVGFSGYTVLPAWATINAGGNLSQLRFNFGQDSSFAGLTSNINGTAGNPGGGGYRGNTDSEGMGDFFYEVPTGYKALCVDNLPDPAIKIPSDYFGNIIYTGDGQSPSPTRVFGFQPDFVWIKERGGTEANAWFDSTRGTNKQMRSNTTGMQTTNAETLKTFAATGFTTGSDDVVNTNNDTYVAYGWLGGGAPTVDNSAGAGNTPTAGSVKINGSNFGSAMAGTLETKRMSANTTAGFSVCNFVGNETAGATIAHGLSQKPEWVIAKVYIAGSGASTSVWYSQPLTIGSDVQGNGSVSFDQGAYDDYAGYWNDTAPNASIVTLGAYSNLNRSSNIIMYSFHSVDGYSKFGGYQGNGNNNGMFIYTGFRPKYFLTKNITQSEHWNHWDDAREPNFNKLNKKLSLSENVAEYTSNTTTYAVDFVSNGVKLRSSYSSLNDNSDYFFFAAFAEWPYKYARAR